MRKVVGVREPVQPAGEVVQDTVRMSQPAITPTEPSTPRTRVQPPTQQLTFSGGEIPDTLVVETRFYRGILSSLGGGSIIGWQLKDYMMGDKDDGNPVELIPKGATGNLGLALDVGVDLSQVVFNVDARERWEEGGVQYESIRFRREFEDGRAIEKEFIFIEDAYAVEMSVRFLGWNRYDIGERYDLLWSSGLAPTEGSIKDDEFYYQAFALQGGEILKTKQEGTGYREGATDWTAVRTKYFVMAMIPQDPQGRAASLEGEKTKVIHWQDGEQDWKQFRLRLSVPTRAVEQSSTYQVYLGPMDYTQLKSFGVKLEKMMNFGWAFIRPISIGFFYTLRFLEGILGNYGWAIIIFSILIKIVLYPLTRKSYQSMKEMQELQPKVAALKEKLKDDPQKLNQETMKLYKQHGVNPMGGCLPMLFQMPVLFALFNLFRTTIMLRQAEFIGLINDLSAPDQILMGINVLPILMGATMIIQQRLTNQNPQQKAMAFFMPIFLTFIFYRLSAGLNLYYLMFNLLTIAQELFIKKKK